MFFVGIGVLDMATFSILYWAGFLLVVVSVVVLGVFAAKKVQNAEDFALAGRSSGVLMVMGTAVGTAVGASSTIGTAQLAFTIGINAWMFCLGAGIAFIIMGIIYVKPLYLSKISTISDFMSLKYNEKTGFVASLFSVIGIFFSAAASSLVLIPMMAANFSVDMTVGALMTLFLIIMYVFFGGTWATGLMGIFKACILFLVLFVSLLVSLKLSGGFAPIINNFSFNPWFNIFPKGIFIDIAAGLSTAIGVMSTQSYVQAMCSAKSEKAARNGMFLAGTFAILSAVPAIWIGLFMKVNHPDVLPIKALTYFITNYLPDWFAGISMGILVIAAVGSAAGLILGMGTIVSTNIITLVVPDFCKKNMLLVTRITIFLITCFVLVFTYINNDALVLDWTILSMCLRGSGIFIPLILAVYKPGKFAAEYAMYAIIAGSLSALSARVFISHLISPLYPGMLVSAIFMCLGYYSKKRLV